MKRVTAMLFGLTLAAGFAAADEGGKIQWRDGKQYDASLAEAKQNGMPLLLYFTATW